MNELKSLGREALIEMAATELRKRNEFRELVPDAFDRIGVSADGEYLWVTFDMSVKYVPLDSHGIYSITVFLYGQQGYSMMPVANPESRASELPRRIFTHTPDTREALDLVMDKLGLGRTLPPGEFLQIVEHPRYFLTERMDADSVDRHKLDRGTWAVYDEVHEDPDLEEDEADAPIEIIED